MLSIFPPLLAFYGFSAFLLRLTLGIIFIIWSYNKYKSCRESRGNKSTSFMASIALEGIVGILLIVGFLTQAVALISAFIFGIELIKKIKSKAFLTDGVNYYFILFIISISLIFTGAGYIALDLPL